MENNPTEDEKEQAEQVEQVPQERKFPKSADFLPKWLRFRTYNQFIEGVNIIPFKCPLKEKWDAHLNKEELFPFKDVYEYSVKMNKPITDVIDLTYTTKYYNPKENEFFPPGVQRHKFKIPGKKIPKKETFDAIMEVMDEAIKKGGAVGVHCTHGINRTGFIICSFLVLKLGWEPEKAIAAFAEARSHKMEHSEYIEAVLAINNKPEESKDVEETGKVEENAAAEEETNVVGSDP